MALPPETFFESFFSLAVGLARMASDAQRLEVRYIVAAAFALGFDMIDLCLSLACTDATTDTTGVCVTHEHDLP
jgi:hypothetical protein